MSPKRGYQEKDPSRHFSPVWKDNRANAVKVRCGKARERNGITSREPTSVRKHGSPRWQVR